MAEPIQIEVEFNGGEGASRAVGELTRDFNTWSRETLEATRRGMEFGNQVRELAGRFSGTVSAVNGLVRALATGQGGLVGGLNAAASAASQIGALFGPQGAVAGSIIGVAVPAFTALWQTIEDATTATRDLEEQTRRTSSTYDELLSRIRQANAAERQRQTLGAGLGTVEEQQANVARAQQTVDALAESMRQIDEQLARGLDARTAARLEGAYASLARERRAAQAEFDRASEALRQQQADQEAETADLMASLGESARAADAPRDRRSGGGGSRERGPSLDDLMGGEGDPRAIAEELLNEAKREAIEITEKLRDVEMERAEALRAQEEARLEEMNEAAEERAEMMERDMELQEEADAANQDAYESRVNRISEITGTIVQGMTDTFVALAMGQKTAEEAAKEMLAGFLQYVSQETALRAAMEFAEAIASFANQKYDSGALHLAAGAGFTAVAVATGVGAAMLVQPPSGAAKPAEPENKGGGEKGGGDVVINWNSPIVTAGTRAELGRTMAQTIRAGEQRFGRA